MVFTRTKHRAKRIARQLNASGVPAVELHGNLSQGARTRTMDAFHSGAAQTLVATDIAARGIHVDDVALVIHADPPVEHKAYLHRSGRTARAGASGTVITLMTDDQVRDVRDLARKAGISPTTTRVTADHPLLRELAPGERAYTGGYAAPLASASSPGRRGNQGGQGSGRRGAGRGRSTNTASTSQGAGRGVGTRGRSRSGSARAAAPAGSAAAFSAGSRAGSRRGR
jgi:superfamily II DNA/RNA helicase